ncbi:MAG: hypothetical protein RMJ19_07580 [Gemmatales bacterium]|nr:hypothetical protein [Gemmatales bacterium]MCS7160317.1 hypothetical protein [Gemmatales bacterium]MDW8175517.1 hypothetical protein [Gemmatales bacterium]MDW8222543.1 hypothetical protein [Gemmatales bacterium]
MRRRAYTLVEALTAVFVLAIGLLALTSMIVGGVLEIRRGLRNESAQQAFENVVSLAKIIGPSVPQPMPNQFVWVYQPLKSPDLPNLPGISATRLPYVPPDQRLGLTLDVQGRYQIIGAYINPNTGQADQRPFLNGLRNTPPDPERYTCAVSVRPVPPNNPDQTLVDISVVIFEDYDPSDPSPQSRPYRLNNASLRLGQPSLAANGPITPGPPARAIILDGQNGYVYRLTEGDVIPTPRANSDVVIVLPKAVEALEAGIISRR